MSCCLDCIQIWYDCSLGISDDLINFWDYSVKNKIAATAILKKIDMVVVWVIFSHHFSILMDGAYGWGVLPSIDGYFYSSWDGNCSCNSHLKVNKNQTESLFYKCIMMINFVQMPFVCGMYLREFIKYSIQEMNCYWNVIIVLLRFNRNTD